MYGVRAIVMGLLSPFSRIFVSSWKGVIEGDMKKLDKIYSSLGQEPNPTVPDLSEFLHSSSSSCSWILTFFLLFLDTSADPTLDALLEIAKAPSTTQQGFINFDKRRDIYLVATQFTKSLYEPSTVKESKEALQQLICMIREPLNKELFGRVKVKAIVSFPTNPAARKTNKNSNIFPERKQRRERQLPPRALSLPGSDC